MHKGRHQERKKGIRELQDSQNTIDKMALVSRFLFIIFPNVNGLNSPTKRYRVAK